VTVEYLVAGKEGAEPAPALLEGDIQLLGFDPIILHMWMAYACACAERFAAAMASACWSIHFRQSAAAAFWTLSAFGCRLHALPDLPFPAGILNEGAPNVSLAQNKFSRSRA